MRADQQSRSSPVRAQHGDGQTVADDLHRRGCQALGLFLRAGTDDKDHEDGSAVRAEDNSSNSTDPGVDKVPRLKQA